MDSLDKMLYGPKEQPIEIMVPVLGFFVIDGAGDPNEAEFGDVIGALYTFAYTVRMAPRKGLDLPGYTEQKIYPLEGVWNLTPEGQALVAADTFQIPDKHWLTYQMMIRQPAFVNEAVFPQIAAVARQKDKNHHLTDVRFERLEEGRCVQLMHVGLYDDEPRSFARLQAYCQTAGLRRRTQDHREIYLSDPRHADPVRMKTVLRWPVESAG